MSNGQNPVAGAESSLGPYAFLRSALRRAPTPLSREVWRRPDPKLRLGPMSVDFRHDSCRKQISVARVYAGQRVRCPRCGEGHVFDGMLSPSLWEAG